MGFLKRLRAVACAAVITVSAVAAASTALAAAAVESFYQFPGTPPSWSVEGSWVKHSSPVIADLDPSRNNGPEIAVGSHDGNLYVLRVSGGKLGLVWKGAIGTIIDSSPSVADLDGDGFREVLVGAGNTDRKHASGVHVFAHDGSNHRHWATPDVPGFSNGVFSAPAVADVTGDGRPEVVFGAFNHHIYVKNATGGDAPGWEGGKLVHDTVWSSASLADVNGDGDREIVIGSDLGGGDAVFGCPKEARGMVSIFDGSGAFLPGWPKCTDTPIWSSPAVVDVTGDGILDVIVGTNNYTPLGATWKVNAWSADGSPLWSTALATGARIFSSPAVGDVTGDGRPEVAVGTIEGPAGRVWLLDAVSGRALWSHDDGAGDGSCCIFMGSPIMTDVSGDGRADVVAAGGDGALHAWDGAGTRIFRLPLGRTLFNSPAAGDVDGDGRTELVAASAGIGSDVKRGRVFVVGTDGTDAGPWPQFRHGADRLGAVGSGRLSGVPPAPVPNPPISGAVSTPRRPAVRKATPATSQPATPTPTPTRAPRALPARERSTGEESSGPMRWVALATVLLAIGAAVMQNRSARARLLPVDQQHDRQPPQSEAHQ